jgi:glutathione S-transferase
MVNHDKIVRFAARGAGTPGFPATAASLADPRSIANEGAEPAVDVLLRHVIHAMLSDSDSGSAIQEFTDALATSPDGEETMTALAECLDYLRLRIGVPRDMSYPAARELKMELLSTARLLLDAASSSASLLEQH